MSVCRAARWAKELGQSTLRANGTRRAQMGRVARAIETRRAGMWDASRARMCDAPRAQKQQIGRTDLCLCNCFGVCVSVCSFLVFPFVFVSVGLLVCPRLLMCLCASVGALIGYMYMPTTQWAKQPMQDASRAQMRRAARANVTRRAHTMDNLRWQAGGGGRTCCHTNYTPFPRITRHCGSINWDIGWQITNTLRYRRQPNPDQKHTHCHAKLFLNIASLPPWLDVIKQILKLACNNFTS